MTGTQTIRMLARYNAWANKTMFDALLALPSGEAKKERQTLFKNMVNTLNHVYVVDLIWQAHLQEREHGIAALSAVLHADLGELWQAQQAIDGWYVAWSDALAETAADELVQFMLIGGNRGAMRRGDILLHVVNHTSYHRGFVADLFFQVPARPPLTDLPIFLKETSV
jgi:uncharacterized damage-inducible protein DinB